MAAKNTKTAELNDIPLTLEQGDSVEMSTTKAQKMKTNSLKRFFRKPHVSKTVEHVDNDNPEIKNAVSLQLRFGTFRKTEGVKPIAQTSPPADTEAGSSTTHPSSASDSRLNLQERLSNYWNNVFKKTSKKATIQELPSLDDPTSTAIQSVVQNQPDN